MQADRHELFRELQPPPGGTARMRAKLRRRRAPFIRSWWAGPVAVGIVAALTIFFFGRTKGLAPSPGGDLLAAVEFDRLLGREIEPLELRVTRGQDQLAVSELETREPNVRFFRIEPDQ